MVYGISNQDSQTLTTETDQQSIKHHEELLPPCSIHDMRAKSEGMQTRLSPKTDKINRAIKFIDDNFAIKINLSLAASKACMSKFHFSRTFKKETGITYQDYLNNRRVEKAKELLKVKKLSVSETALSVGYKDITHFERIFKGIVGVTPSSYKKGNNIM
jgi:two-component system response regulator YesN